jgi:chromosome segregation ATPase
MSTSNPNYEGDRNGGAVADKDFKASVKEGYHKVMKKLDGAVGNDDGAAFHEQKEMKYKDPGERAEFHEEKGEHHADIAKGKAGAAWENMEEAVRHGYHATKEKIKETVNGTKDTLGYDDSKAHTEQYEKENRIREDQIRRENAQVNANERENEELRKQKARENDRIELNEKENARIRSGFGPAY